MTSLRELLDDAPRPIVAPGVFDALSAKVIESLGYSCLYLGGWVMGAHRGKSEPLLSLTDVCDACYSIAGASSTPLIVDAGAGWGEPLNVRHAARELSRAGVAAFHIEDQVFPKRATYFAGTKHLVAIDEMSDRIRAAVAGAGCGEVMVVARTDAWTPDDPASLDEALRRLSAYREAGADILMPMVKDLGQWGPLRDAFPDVPLIWNQYFAGPTLAEVAAAGASIAIFPQASTLCAVDGILRAFTDVKEKGRIEAYDSRRMNFDLKRRVLSMLGVDEQVELEASTTERRSWGGLTVNKRSTEPYIAPPHPK